MRLELAGCDLRSRPFCSEGRPACVRRDGSQHIAADGRAVLRLGA
jgi:hypothetical protein